MPEIKKKMEKKRKKLSDHLLELSFKDIQMSGHSNGTCEEIQILELKNKCWPWRNFTLFFS